MRKNWIIVLLSFAASLTAEFIAVADDFQPNYDEAKVPDYTLPDPLVAEDGQRVTDSETWQQKRRGEILRLFETHVYGRSPGRPENTTFDVLSVDGDALGGTAIRKEISISFRDNNDGPKIDVLIYQPRCDQAVPAFLALNFYGNHTIQDDPGIKLSRSWMRNAPGRGVVNHRATEKSRATSTDRWPVETIVERGYALATAYYGDIDPDYDDGFQNGVHSLFYRDGQARPTADEWGSIGAWAWGLSRILDYLETDESIDHRCVAVMGHSRLGKTALWAAARDERFAMAISNNSGCGGAALSRRRFGETVARINTAFPHWFCENFKKYNDNEDALPVDQHMLIALCAPRPVYVASAAEDRWADPRGEFLAVKHAEPAYHLLGADRLETFELPAVDEPVASGSLGYHIRSGKHDVTDFDWQQYLDFADRQLRLE